MRRRAASARRACAAAVATTALGRVEGGAAAVLLAVGLLAGLPGCGGSAKVEPAAPAAHSSEVAAARDLGTLPPLVLPRLAHDGSWRAADHLGRYLVVDVWATWCAPCRKGFPSLNALAAAHPAVSFVAISVDDDDSGFDAFLAETPIAFTIVHDLGKAVTRPPLSLTQVPVVLLVDPAGRIIWKVDSPAEADYRALAERLAALASPAQ